VQRRIAAEVLAAQLGTDVDVLVEGASDEPGERLGRTPENRLVHLVAEEGRAPAGSMVRARVTRAGGSSLSGVLA
jgi:tRNA-2-methylthio-N6-dimethylallyladenosine synthase